MKVDPKSGVPVVVVMEILLLPRGSGNRNTARRLANHFRTNAELKPHVKKVVCGTSRVTVHLIPSIDLLQIIEDIKRRQREADLPGQLPLFGLA